MSQHDASSEEGDILIVDDNPTNLRLLSATLSERGYLVRKALNGQRALDSALAEPPDLILLDIQMPEMDGYEVCRQLKSNDRTRKVPIVFISALDEVFDKVKAFSSGGVDYIAKPIQTEEAIARVGTQIALHRLHRNLDRQVEERTSQLTQALQELRDAKQQLEHSFAEAIAAKEAAESAARAKSKFLSQMSHELCTPLNAIIGFSDLLKMQVARANLPANCLESIAEINQAGWQLHRLVERLLQLGNLETHKTSLKVSRFRVGELVAEVIENLKSLASCRNNRLTVRFLNDGGIADSDRKKLSDILFNLLENACKFTEAGEIELTVSRSEEGSTAQLTFQIRDTGIGIAPEDSERIFQPFTQVDESSTRHYEGAGLGLAIARQFCQIMGGEISLESELGRGSTFTVHLPASSATEALQLPCPEP